MITVTLDTNAVDEQTRTRIERACRGRAVEIAHTTVTDRELEGSAVVTAPAALQETMAWGESRWGQSVWGGGRVRETLVLDESRLDEAVLGGEDAPARFEAILDIISNGSFPRAGKRDSLPRGQRKQLRDAMILEAHARDGRDVLVSNDERAFIRDGRRGRLEALCSTRIMTVEEFLAFVVEAT